MSGPTKGENVIPVRLWTRKCRGCTDTSAHTHHLTWLGRLALRLRSHALARLTRFVEDETWPDHPTAADLATVRDELQRLREERAREEQERLLAEAREEIDRFGGEVWKNRAADMRRALEEITHDSNPLTMRANARRALAAADGTKEEGT